MSVPIASTNPSPAQIPPRRPSRRRYRTVDEFYRARGAGWDELRRLVRSAGSRRAAALGPDAVYRLATLYRSTSADLATAQLRFGRSHLVVELNDLVAAAHNVLYGEQKRLSSRIVEFLLRGFPATVRANATFIWIGALVFIAAIAAGVAWFALAPNSAQDAFGLAGGTLNKAQVPLTTPAESATSFVEIAVNNIRVAFLAFALGVLGCIGTYFLLGYNGLILGVLGAYAFKIGQGADFLALVTPHGVVELTVIVIAGAAGLRIGWAVISPGRRRRGLALAAAGREAVRILIGTIPLFIVAALVEGFVTTAGMPIAVNIAFGWIFGIAVWIYLFRRGTASPSEPPSP